MANIITNNQYYTDIANAIRGKNGENTQYLPSEMALAINEIQTALTGSFIIVTIDAGSTVFIKNLETNEIVNSIEDNGTWTFSGCKIGTWKIFATSADKTKTAEHSFEIIEENQMLRYYVILSYDICASDFDWASYGTLGVDYEIIDDNDVAIQQDKWSSEKNWNARLLTSSTLISLKDGEIDVFAIGGGTGGRVGNSGDYVGYSGSYVEQNVTLNQNSSYPINIGAGSRAAEHGGDWLTGGTTTAFDLSATGGEGYSNDAVTKSEKVRPFGKTTGNEYGGANPSAGAGRSNTGEAGRGYYSGGSGIVIIRNKRS